MCTDGCASEIAAAERALRQSQEDLLRSQEIAHIGTWTWDAATDLHDSSTPESFRIFGISAGAGPIDTARLFAQIHIDDRERVAAARQRLLTREDATCDVRFRVIHPDGSMHHVRSVAEARFNPQGHPVTISSVVQDITGQVRAAEEIARLAYYDDMTGLPNRILFRKRIDEVLENDSATVALLIVDLQRFKEINYSLGHLNGNALLKALAARIASLREGADLVARIGTRFIMMLPGASVAAAESKALAILAALEYPFPVVGITYELSATIGIAAAPSHGSDVDTLLRKADIAIFQAKHSGRNVAVYDAARDPYNPQRLALIGEFRNAIRNGELQLYCQPKAELVSGNIVGAEALVRWLHPKLGLIAPAQFIPLIESTDLIHVLTHFVLQRAVAQCDSWRKLGAHVPLAVNLSTRNLMERDLIDRLQHLLSCWDADPDWIGLEITEGSLMQDPATCIAELVRLSRMGFRLFVDDFGTGYSSLSYLARLPVNVIKIDHGFTMDMTRDKSAATIVKSTIDLAHNLGMSVVAEGTADGEIWSALVALGCDEAQGHFIAPPMPAGDFLGWLTASRYSLTARPPVPS